MAAGRLCIYVTVLYCIRHFGERGDPKTPTPVMRLFYHHLIIKSVLSRWSYSIDLIQRLISAVVVNERSSIELCTQAARTCRPSVFSQINLCAAKEPANSGLRSTTFFFSTPGLNIYLLRSDWVGLNTMNI